MCNLVCWWNVPSHRLLQYKHIHMGRWRHLKRTSPRTPSSHFWCSECKIIAHSSLSLNLFFRYQCVSPHSSLSMPQESNTLTQTFVGRRWKVIFECEWLFVNPFDDCNVCDLGWCYRSWGRRHLSTPTRLFWWPCWCASSKLPLISSYLDISLSPQQCTNLVTLHIMALVLSYHPWHRVQMHFSAAFPHSCTAIDPILMN